MFIFVTFQLIFGFSEIDWGAGSNHPAGRRLDHTALNNDKFNIACLFMQIQEVIPILV